MAMNTTKTSFAWLSRLRFRAGVCTSFWRTPATLHGAATVSNAIQVQTEASERDGVVESLDGELQHRGRPTHPRLRPGAYRLGVVLCKHKPPRPLASILAADKALYVY